MVYPRLSEDIFNIVSEYGADPAALDNIRLFGVCVDECQKQMSGCARAMAWLPGGTNAVTRSFKRATDCSHESAARDVVKI